MTQRREVCCRNHNKATQGALVHQTAALHTAAESGRLDTMRILIQYGADVNEAIPDWHGWKCMYFAA